MVMKLFQSNLLLRIEYSQKCNGPFHQFSPGHSIILCIELQEIKFISANKFKMVCTIKFCIKLLIVYYGHDDAFKK